MVEEALVEEAVKVLPRIVKQLQATFGCYAEASGLTLGQMKALVYLYHHGQVTVGEVADGLGLAMPTASELIDKLAERQLLAREVNPLNRRQVLVSLTDDAMTFAQEIYELRRAQIRQAFNGLSADEQAVVVRGLQALSEAISPNGDLPCSPIAATLPRLVTPAGS